MISDRTIKIVEIRCHRKVERSWWNLTGAIRWPQAIRLLFFLQPDIKPGPVDWCSQMFRRVKSADFTFPIDFRRAAQRWKSARMRSTHTAAVAFALNHFFFCSSQWAMRNFGFPLVSNFSKHFISIWFALRWALQWSYLHTRSSVGPVEAARAVAGILLTFQPSIRYKCICSNTHTACALVRCACIVSRDIYSSDFSFD